VSRTLQAKSALDGLARPGRYGSGSGEPGIVIAERTGLGLATVAARKGKIDALRQAVAKSYGAELPSASRMAQGPQVSFLGYGPGQWLAVSASLACEALARDLSQKLKGLASISDQSGGRTVIRISGPRARDVLAKGLPIDLDPRVFTLGSAATSVISHMGVQLWQTDDTPSYDIAVFRSVSESFWRWLTASGAEYGYEVVPERV
jgi:heterotetrameric sarcosine oxidase gamma subunit